MSKSNYFFCVRVTNPAVHGAVNDALDWVLDKDPQYTDFCYTNEMLHVTLCEVCLETTADIAAASDALKVMEGDLQRMRPQSDLTLQGVSTFFDKVMVVNVGYEPDFKQFADTIAQRMKDAGVNVVEKHAFNPHMTIMKVNTMRAKKKKVNPINPWTFVNLKKTLMGSQSVNSVHLCQMGYNRRPDGFYVTPAEVMFS